MNITHIKVFFKFVICFCTRNILWKSLVNVVVNLVIAVSVYRRSEQYKKYNDSNFIMLYNKVRNLCKWRNKSLVCSLFYCIIKCKNHCRKNCYTSYNTDYNTFRHYDTDICTEFKCHKAQSHETGYCRNRTA